MSYVTSVTVGIVFFFFYLVVVVVCVLCVVCGRAVSSRHAVAVYSPRSSSWNAASGGCKQTLFQSRMRLSGEQDIFQGDAPEQRADSANLEGKMSTLKMSLRVCFFHFIFFKICVCLGTFKVPVVFWDNIYFIISKYHPHSIRTRWLIREKWEWLNNNTGAVNKSRNRQWSQVTDLIVRLE